ncbi:hypothetical protein PAPYR_9945 [Paratrimastix pyriformis]|uniref:Separase n=1 Tax=Paratrimastix pyriformis TaxID=342808 RepID=A0ABQ8UCN3_9EUKA|nr:hypothetical protein PAPYR_9945 [Paratrimastix pyriformis]
MAQLLVQFPTRYAATVPAEALAAKLLEFGQTLFSAKAFDSALNDCYLPALALCDHFPVPNTGVDDDTKNDIFHTLLCESRLGVALCRHALLLAEDPALHSTRTLQRLSGVMDSILDAAQRLRTASPKRHCGLIRKAVECCHRCCQDLTRSGYYGQSCGSLVCAAGILESCVPLKAVAHLPFRCTLYRAVCLAAEGAGDIAKAEFVTLPSRAAYADHAVGQVTELMELERSDEVAPSSDTIQIMQPPKTPNPTLPSSFLQTALLITKVLQLKYALIRGKITPSNAVVQVDELVVASLSGPEPAHPGSAPAAQSSPARPASAKGGPGKQAAPGLLPTAPAPVRPVPSDGLVLPLRLDTLLALLEVCEPPQDDAWPSPSFRPFLFLAYRVLQSPRQRIILEAPRPADPAKGPIAVSAAQCQVVLDAALAVLQRAIAPSVGQEGPPATASAEGAPKASASKPSKSGAEALVPKDTPPVPRPPGPPLAPSAERMCAPDPFLGIPSVPWLAHQAGFCPSTPVHFPASLIQTCCRVAFAYRHFALFDFCAAHVEDLVDSSTDPAPASFGLVVSVLRAVWPLLPAQQPSASTPSVEQAATPGGSAFIEVLASLLIRCLREQDFPEELLVDASLVLWSHIRTYREGDAADSHNPCGPPSPLPLPLARSTVLGGLEAVLAAQSRPPPHRRDVNTHLQAALLHCGLLLEDEERALEAQLAHALHEQQRLASMLLDPSARPQPTDLVAGSDAERPAPPKYDRTYARVVEVASEALATLESHCASFALQHTPLDNITCMSSFLDHLDSASRPTGGPTQKEGSSPWPIEGTLRCMGVDLLRLKLRAQLALASVRAIRAYNCTYLKDHMKLATQEALTTMRGSEPPPVVTLLAATKSGDDEPLTSGDPALAEPLYLFAPGAPTSPADYWPPLFTSSSLARLLVSYGTNPQTLALLHTEAALLWSGRLMLLIQTAPGLILLLPDESAPEESGPRSAEALSAASMTRTLKKPRSYNPDATLAATITRGGAEPAAPAFSPSQAAILCTAPLVATLPPRPYAQLRRTYLKAAEQVTCEVRAHLQDAMALLEKAGHAECALRADWEQTSRRLSRAHHRWAVDHGQEAETQMGLLAAIAEETADPASAQEERALAAPLFVCRTGTAITLRPQPTNPEAKYVVVFGKASEESCVVSPQNRLLRGTGVPQAAGSEVVVSDLDPNISYIFACAEYNADAAPGKDDPLSSGLGPIGPCTAPVQTAHPVPLPYLWALVSRSVAATRRHLEELSTAMRPDAQAQESLRREFEAQLRAAASSSEASMRATRPATGLTLAAPPAPGSEGRRSVASGSCLRLLQDVALRCARVAYGFAVDIEQDQVPPPPPAAIRSATLGVLSSAVAAATGDEVVWSASGQDRSLGATRLYGLCRAVAIVQEGLKAAALCGDGHGSVELALTLHRLATEQGLLARHDHRSPLLERAMVVAVESLCQTQACELSVYAAQPILAVLLFEIIAMVAADPARTQQAMYWTRMAIKRRVVCRTLVAQLARAANMILGHPLKEEAKSQTHNDGCPLWHAFALTPSAAAGLVQATLSFDRLVEFCSLHQLLGGVPRPSSAAPAPATRGVGKPSAPSPSPPPPQAPTQVPPTVDLPADDQPWTPAALAATDLPVRLLADPWVTLTIPWLPCFVGQVVLGLPSLLAAVRQASGPSPPLPPRPQALDSAFGPLDATVLPLLATDPAQAWALLMAAAPPTPSLPRPTTAGSAPATARSGAAKPSTTGAVEGATADLELVPLPSWGSDETRWLRLGLLCSYQALHRTPSRWAEVSVWLSETLLPLICAVCRARPRLPKLRRFALLTFFRRTHHIEDAAVPDLLESKPAVKSTAKPTKPPAGKPQASPPPQDPTPTPPVAAPPSPVDAAAQILAAFQILRSYRSAVRRWRDTVQRLAAIQSSGELLLGYCDAVRMRELAGALPAPLSERLESVPGSLAHALQEHGSTTSPAPAPDTPAIVTGSPPTLDSVLTPSLVPTWGTHRLQPISAGPDWGAMPWFVLRDPAGVGTILEAACASTFQTARATNPPAVPAKTASPTKSIPPAARPPSSPSPEPPKIIAPPPCPGVMSPLALQWFALSRYPLEAFGARYSRQFRDDIALCPAAFSCGAEASDSPSATPVAPATKAAPAKGAAALPAAVPVREGVASYLAAIRAISKLWGSGPEAPKALNADGLLDAKGLAPLLAAAPTATGLHDPLLTGAAHRAHLVQCLRVAAHHVRAIQLSARAHQPMLTFEGWRLLCTWLPSLAGACSHCLATHPEAPLWDCFPFPHDKALDEGGPFARSAQAAPWGEAVGLRFLALRAMSTLFARALPPLLDAVLCAQKAPDSAPSEVNSDIARWRAWWRGQGPSALGWIGDLSVGLLKTGLLSSVTSPLQDFLGRLAELPRPHQSLASLTTLLGCLRTLLRHPALRDNLNLVALCQIGGPFDPPSEPPGAEWVDSLTAALNLTLATETLERCRSLVTGYKGRLSRWRSDLLHSRVVARAQERLMKQKEAESATASAPPVPATPARPSTANRPHSSASPAPSGKRGAPPATTPAPRPPEESNTLFLDMGRLLNIALSRTCSADGGEWTPGRVPPSPNEVLAAYEACIGLLEKRHETFLLAQANCELGSFRHHLAILSLELDPAQARLHLKATQQAWIDGLDACFGQPEMLKQWRQTALGTILGPLGMTPFAEKQDPHVTLSAQEGAFCDQGITLETAAKFPPAQCRIASLSPGVVIIDWVRICFAPQAVDQTTECALCACAAVTAALVQDGRAPLRLCQWADYEIEKEPFLGSPAPLEDIRLTGDAQLLAEALEFVIVRAWHAGFGLLTLPALALLRYVALRSVADSALCAHARVLTAQVLLDIGCMGEAHLFLMRSFAGMGLPSLFVDTPPFGPALVSANAPIPAASNPSKKGTAAGTVVLTPTAFAPPGIPAFCLSDQGTSISAELFFHSEETPESPANLEAIGALQTAALHPEVANIYGPTVVSELLLARVAFLLCCSTHRNLCPSAVASLVAPAPRAPADMPALAPILGDPARATVPPMGCGSQQWWAKDVWNPCFAIPKAGPKGARPAAGASPLPPKSKMVTNPAPSPPGTQNELLPQLRIPSPISATDLLGDSLPDGVRLEPGDRVFQAALRSLQAFLQWVLPAVGIDPATYLPRGGEPLHLLDPQAWAAYEALRLRAAVARLEHVPADELRVGQTMAVLLSAHVVPRGLESEGSDASRVVFETHRLVAWHLLNTRISIAETAVRARIGGAANLVKAVAEDCRLAGALQMSAPLDLLSASLLAAEADMGGALLAIVRALQCAVESHSPVSTTALVLLTGCRFLLTARVTDSSEFSHSVRLLLEFVENGAIAATRNRPGLPKKGGWLSPTGPDSEERRTLGHTLARAACDLLTCAHAQLGVPAPQLCLTGHDATPAAVAEALRFLYHHRFSDPGPITTARTPRRSLYIPTLTLLSLAVGEHLASTHLVPSSVVTGTPGPTDASSGEGLPTTPVAKSYAIRNTLHRARAQAQMRAAQASQFAARRLQIHQERLTATLSRDPMMPGQGQVGTFDDFGLEGQLNVIDRSMLEAMRLTLCAEQTLTTVGFFALWRNLLTIHVQIPHPSPVLLASLQAHCARIMRFAVLPDPMQKTGLWGGSTNLLSEPESGTPLLHPWFSLWGAFVGRALYAAWLGTAPWSHGLLSSALIELVLMCGQPWAPALDHLANNPKKDVIFGALARICPAEIPAEPELVRWRRLRLAQGALLLYSRLMEAERMQTHLPARLLEAQMRPAELPLNSIPTSAVPHGLLSDLLALIGRTRTTVPWPVPSSAPPPPAPVGKKPEKAVQPPTPEDRAQTPPSIGSDILARLASQLAREESAIREIPLSLLALYCPTSSAGWTVHASASSFDLVDTRLRQLHQCLAETVPGALPCSLSPKEPAFLSCARTEDPTTGPENARFLESPPNSCSLLFTQLPARSTTHADMIFLVYAIVDEHRHLHVGLRSLAALESFEEICLQLQSAVCELPELLAPFGCDGDLDTQGLRVALRSHVQRRKGAFYRGEGALWALELLLRLGQVTEERADDFTRSEATKAIREWLQHPTAAPTVHTQEAAPSPRSGHSLLPLHRGDAMSSGLLDVLMTDPVLSPDISKKLDERMSESGTAPPEAPDECRELAEFATACRAGTSLTTC